MLPSSSQLDDWVWRFQLRETLMSDFQHIVRRADRAEVRNSLLKTVLGLEIYRRQHGSYPETLALLVPDFMSEIPDDIYDPSESRLKYRRDGVNATLWSVAWNGVDDAGNVEAGWANVYDQDLGYDLGPPKPKPALEPDGEELGKPD